MNDFESDLTLLENLSKKISDLIYNNQFNQISEIDKQRLAIIEKIKNSEISHLQIKSRISDLIINNNEMLISTQNKFKKWDDRFSTRRIKCKGTQDIKYLKVFDICNNNASGNNCTYNNTRNYNGTGIYEKWIVGKMEVNLNSGKKKKFLYFQID